MQASNTRNIASFDDAITATADSMQGSETAAINFIAATLLSGVKNPIDAVETTYKRVFAELMIRNGSPNMGAKEAKAQGVAGVSHLLNTRTLIKKLASMGEGFAPLQEAYNGRLTFAQLRHMANPKKTEAAAAATEAEAAATEAEAEAATAEAEEVQTLRDEVARLESENARLLMLLAEVKAAKSIKEIRAMFAA